MNNIIEKLKEFKEKQAFALIGPPKGYQEIARGIIHKGKCRMTHKYNTRFGNELKEYEDFDIEEMPTLLEKLKSDPLGNNVQKNKTNQTPIQPRRKQKFRTPISKRIRFWNRPNKSTSFKIQGLLRPHPNNT